MLQVGLGVDPVVWQGGLGGKEEENHALVVATKPKSKPKPTRPSTATPKLTAAGGNRLLMAPADALRAPSAQRVTQLPHRVAADPLPALLARARDAATEWQRSMLDVEEKVHYKHEDWIKSARLMAHQPSGGGVVMNLGNNVPIPMVHDVRLLGLRLEETGPALALQLASLLERVQPERDHVRPDVLCPELLRAATARLRAVLGMEHVERLMTSAHFREAAVGLDLGVLVDAEQLPQLHLMLTEVCSQLRESLGFWSCFPEVVRVCVFDGVHDALTSAAAAHAAPGITRFSLVLSPTHAHALTRHPSLSHPLKHATRIQPCTFRRVPA